MLSPWGVDHGEVSKALNPLKMLRGAKPSASPVRPPARDFLGEAPGASNRLAIAAGNKNPSVRQPRDSSNPVARRQFRAQGNSGATRPVSPALNPRLNFHGPSERL